MRTQGVRFPGSQEALLAGRLDQPDETPRAFALVAHCFTCTKDVEAASRISRALTAHGIAALRFDFTGLGDSDGEIANANFSSNVADLVRAADYLRDQHSAPTVLIGHSLGGAAVLAAAGEVPEVRAVATIAAPSDAEHLGHLLSDDREHREGQGPAQVHLTDRPFRIHTTFLKDLSSQQQRERIKRLDADLLVLHSPTDQVVGIDNAQRIFQAARHPKSFMALEGADHLLSRPSDADFVASVVAAWAQRHFPEPDPAPEPELAPGAASTLALAESLEGTVVVSENEQRRYGQRVVAGRHVLAADEPVPLGRDSGPSPYDFLLAGLGACTSMTLRMYADRKKWPLEHVSVSLRHSRIHAKDCEDCETTSGRLDRIDRVVKVVGNLDDAQRARLLEIADRCPVHRTLHSEISIRSTLADPED